MRIPDQPGFLILDSIMIKKYKSSDRPEELTTVKKPDVKDIRFRRPFGYSAVNNAVIKAFLKKYPKYSHYTPRELKSIIYLQCKKISDVIATTRDGVELQSSIGHIFVASVKVKNTRKLINYAASFKAGVTVFHRNLHTDGHVAKIWYSNYGVKYKLTNRQVWYFNGTRDLKRLVAKVYPENWQKYALVDHNVLTGNLKRISDEFNKKRGKKLAAKETFMVMENYDEFNLD